MRILLILAACALAGCATHPRTAKVHPAPASSPGVATRKTPWPATFVESRYEIGGYRDPADPVVWHEAHCILRATEVTGQGPPAVSESGPLTAYEPVTYAPLPPSAELAAVLEQERQITAELRAMRARMASLQGQAQSQYGQLVAETEATDRLRQQLAGEAARLKQQQDGAHAVTSTGADW